MKKIWPLVVFILIRAISPLRAGTCFTPLGYLNNGAVSAYAVTPPDRRHHCPGPQPAEGDYPRDCTAFVGFREIERSTLALSDGNGTLLESNDNWGDSPNKQAIIDSTVAPTHPMESAIVRTLAANGAQYTAIVRGVADTTGVAVVEAYALQ